MIAGFPARVRSRASDVLTMRSRDSGGGLLASATQEEMGRISDCCRPNPIWTKRTARIRTANGCCRAVEDAGAIQPAVFTARTPATSHPHEHARGGACESFRRIKGLGTFTADGKNACGGATATLVEADALDGLPV